MLQNKKNEYEFHQNTFRCFIKCFNFDEWKKNEFLKLTTKLSELGYILSE